MRSSILAFFFSAAGLAALTFTQSACLACNDIGCAGGFEWSARVENGGALPADEYLARIDLEGTVYEVSCQVAATSSESECAEPQRVEGEGDFALFFNLQQLDQVDWDPASPVAGFALDAVDVSGSDDQGSYSENRGPTSVDISITRSAGPVLAVDYQPEYDRNEDYRGDPRCGFCDQLAPIDESFPAPV